MRRSTLILMTLFALGLTASANAQTRQTSATAADRQATADAMVARMMSFDRNRDGLVSRDELPERMQPLLARIEVFTTGDAVDEKEIRRLADNPVAKPQVFVLQAGHYGFGDDNGFDTRLHIQSAIEDLRLASATRDQALDIGRRFADAASVQARADLIAALMPLVTEEQMAGVNAALDRQHPLRISALASDDPARMATLTAMVSSAERELQQRQLSVVLASFALGAEQDRQAKAALEQFKSHEHLAEGDRAALLAQMRGVLSDQERDDLRAALERRPVIKQGGAAGVFAVDVKFEIE